jgi:hypothetical protein
MVPQVAQHREGEAGMIPFRTGRFFNVGGNWYFTTPEAIDQGPYASRQEAEAALVHFLENIVKVERTWN